MTTNRTFDEFDEGDLSAAKPTGEPCPKCKTGRELHQLWTSSDEAYEDSKYTCTACPHVRWVDGIDS